MVGAEVNFVDFLRCVWAACFQFVPALMNENVVYIVTTAVTEKLLESKATVYTVCELAAFYMIRTPK